MTINFLRLCYHCDDACLCQTEEQCLACWNEQDMTPQDHEMTGQEETMKWMRLAYD
ncbi:hypothetical protein [Paenibacillus sp. AK002]